MDWREKYKDKMTTAAEAVKYVKSEKKSYLLTGSRNCPALVDALVARYKELENATIIHGMSPGPNEYLEEKYEGHFAPYFPFHRTKIKTGLSCRKSRLSGRNQFPQLARYVCKKS